VDRGVIATANELLEARHYPSVVAIVTDALAAEPECVDLLLIRARAHIALRRDLDAQADLRDIIRLDPQAGPAFRLLGELAARRDEHESAAIFFREALRLDPSDREAADWLAIVESTSRPAAAARIPANAAAAGRFPAQQRGPQPRASSSGGPTRPQPSLRRAASEPPAIADAVMRPRAIAAGTKPPAETEATTARFARGSEPPESVVWKTPAPAPAEIAAKMTLPGEVLPPRRPLAAPPRPLSRGPTPELPGFGEYLVASGILTRERLRAAQAYQRSMKVQLATAIVTLGLATPQRIEWAAVAHQSQLARDRQGG
jgi:hypothetical protein